LIDLNEEMRIKELKSNIDDEFSRYDSVFALFDEFEGGLLRAVSDHDLDNFALAKFNLVILDKLESLNSKSRDTNIYRRLLVRVQSWRDKSRLWELMLQQKVKTQENWDEFLKMVGKLRYNDITLEDLEGIDLDPWRKFIKELEQKASKRWKIQEMFKKIRAEWDLIT